LRESFVHQFGDDLAVRERFSITEPDAVAGHAPLTPEFEGTSLRMPRYCRAQKTQRQLMLELLGERDPTRTPEMAFSRASNPARGGEAGRRSDSRSRAVARRGQRLTAARRRPDLITATLGRSGTFHSD
jgi:hypothetical protein